jgi:hypothetical protein
VATRKSAGRSVQLLSSACYRLFSGSLGPGRAGPASGDGGDVTMGQVDMLYEACGRLFAEYPLAARAVDLAGAVNSMILMVDHGENLGFFVLLQDRSDGRILYSLSQWEAGEDVDIDADGSVAIPAALAEAITNGMPLPRHGSLFGWRSGNTVTALVSVHTKRTSACPEPCWVVMPRAGGQETEWPPFTGGRVLGHWVWDYLHAGNLVSLGEVVARTPGTVFWMDAEPVMGWTCCVVASDIFGPEGCTLRRGRYVYYRALQAVAPVPPLSVLLADSRKVDLAPRFWRSAIQSIMTPGQ